MYDTAQKENFSNKNLQNICVNVNTFDEFKQLFENEKN